jgi:hypothetical protein
VDVVRRVRCRPDLFARRGRQHGDGQRARRGQLARALIEECWSDQAGLDRMAGMLTRATCTILPGETGTSPSSGQAWNTWSRCSPGAGIRSSTSSMTAGWWQHS